MDFLAAFPVKVFKRTFVKSAREVIKNYDNFLNDS